MANPSIYAAFERLWLNINAVFSKVGHTHDDKYYTEAEVDAKIASASTAVKNDLLNGAGGAYDTLKELGDLIDDNADAIDALETIAAGKADASTVTAHTGNTTVHITDAERTTWNAKQNALIFDSTPTANSANPVTSDGIKSAINVVQDQIDNLSDSMLRKVELTQAEYDALTEKDPAVIYIITDEEDSNFIAEDQKGVAGGVASLDSSGKVPAAQLPSMDYVPNSNKGVANGVATLGSDGKVPESQLPTMGGHYVGTSAPSNTNLLWINTSNNTINYYTGSAWKAIGAVFG